MRVVTAALVAVALLVVFAATVAGDFDWAGPRPMRRVRAASDRQTSAIWNHELCGPRGVQLLTDFDGFLVAGPLCVSELFTSLAKFVFTRAQGLYGRPHRRRHRDEITQRHRQARAA